MPTIKEALKANVDLIKDPNKLRELVIILSGVSIGDLNCLSEALTKLKGRLDNFQRAQSKEYTRKISNEERETVSMVHILTSVSTIAIGERAKRDKMRK